MALRRFEDEDVLAVIDLGNHHDMNTPSMYKLAEMFRCSQQAMRERVRAMVDEGLLNVIARRYNDLPMITHEVTVKGAMKLKE